MDRLIVTQLNDRVCTAAVSGSRITQLMMEPEDSSSLLNDIYIGKVQKVVGNINAAFVDIGGGRTGYYLSLIHIYTFQQNIQGAL